MSLAAIDVLIARAEARAILWRNWQMDMPEAVDALQAYAEDSALVACLGQDVVQEIIAESFGFYTTGEIETLDIPDEQPAREFGAGEIKPVATYRTAKSTINAFWYVVRQGDAKQLAAWLADHPADAPHLHNLWRARCSTKAA